MSNTDKGLRPGTTLDSGTRIYTVIRTLGAGGFGITYLVQGTIGNINSFFAIKEHFISNKCERDDHQTVCYSRPVKKEVEDSLRDFISEANRLNAQDVRHPNIVGINEVFRANNTAYYVMEYVAGKNLRQTVTKDRGGRPFTQQEALDILAPVLDAICLMHRARITHLDLKPDNILMSANAIDNSLRPVIIDFGVSKHYDESGEATSTINVVACSPGYAPMEQYLGITTFTPQADVYALAATLYFLLTGHDPQKADQVSPQSLDADLRDVTDETVRRAIIHAMASARISRTPTVEEFRKELGLAPVSGQVTENITSDHDNGEKDGNEEKKKETGSGAETIVLGTNNGAGMTKDKGKPGKPARPDATVSSRKWWLIAAGVALIGVIIWMISTLIGTDTQPEGDPTDSIYTVESLTAIIDTTAYVIDPAGRISAAAAEALTAVGTELLDTYGDRLLVAVIPSTGGVNLSQFSGEMLNAISSGESETENILLAVDLDTANACIRVGSGLEHLISGETCDLIIESEFIPIMKQGNLEAAVIATVNKIAETIRTNQADGQVTEAVEEATDSVMPVAAATPKTETTADARASKVQKSQENKPASAASTDPMEDLKRRANAGDRAAALQVAKYYMGRGGSASDLRNAAAYAKKAGSEGKQILETVDKMGLND